MAEDNHPKLLEEATLAKVRAEVSRIKADEERIRAETKTLETLRWFPWAQKKHIAQVFIAVVLLGPLVWFYVNEVAWPLYSIENIQLSRENAIVRDSLVVVGIRFDELSQILIRTQESLIAQKAEAESHYQALANEYRLLSRRAETLDSERLRFAQRADSLQALVGAIGISRPGQPIVLREGWNLVPYTPMISMPIERAFSSISSDLVLVKDDEGRVFAPEFAVNQLEVARPGKAYMVNVRRAGTLVYP